MKHRKLRIAWSVICGTACVLLIALWVRSYWIEDFCEWSSQTRNFGAYSNDGVLILDRSKFFSVPYGFHFGELPARPWAYFTSWPQPIAGISFHASDLGLSATVSYGWVLVVTAMVAIAPWTSLAPRFSLRILLIAASLVALLLGAIVSIVR